MADEQDLFHSGFLRSCIIFFSIPALPAFVEGDFPRDRPSAGLFFGGAAPGGKRSGRRRGGAVLSSDQTECHAAPGEGAAELQKALNATQTAVCVDPPGLLCWYHKAIK